MKLNNEQLIDCFNYIGEPSKQSFYELYNSAKEPFPIPNPIESGHSFAIKKDLKNSFNHLKM